MNHLQELWDSATGVRKALLRECLHEIAENNPTAAIFLAKEALGMSDYRDPKESAKAEDKLLPPLLKMLERKMESLE